MRIEIDQSGKLEDTHKPTVVGFSNSKHRTIIILATEKQKLQKYFRKINKPKLYIYATFAILIYFLIKNKKEISHMIIDREYPGQEPLIKNYLLGLFKKSTRGIDKEMISFSEIGKAAPIHTIVWECYRAKRADEKIQAQDIIRKLSK